MELIETMLVTNSNIKNFKYHLKRVENTFKFFKWKFNQKEWEKLKEKFTFKQKPLRVRVTYNQFGIKEIELFDIKKREFKKFKTIDINFNYSFKYKNRKNFENLYQKYPNFDEFILVKNGLITDTTISNLAFFTGKEWLSPKNPLLKGTVREKLLNEKKIKLTDIHKADLKYFKKIAMINAILGFREIEDFDIIN